MPEHTHTHTYIHFYVYRQCIIAFFFSKVSRRHVFFPEILVLFGTTKLHCRLMSVNEVFIIESWISANSVFV
jgi:hypothetical protein